MTQPSQVTLDIENDVQDEHAQRSNSNLQRSDSVARPVSLNRSNMGLSDRLNSVIREIRPLVEHAGSNARLSLPTWLPRNPPLHQVDSLQRAQSSIAHVNLSPAAQTEVATDRVFQRSQVPGISSSSSNDSHMSDTAAEPEINPSVNPANSFGINNENVDQEAIDDEPVIDRMRSTLNILVKYAPFYFILLIKSVYDMRQGLGTFIILFATFCHSNIVVRREHGKQTNRHAGALLLELAASALVVGAVHAVFGHGKLLRNVVMFPAYEGRLDIWELLWLVILTDLIVKIITVDLKLLVVLMPARVLPFQKRGKVFLFLESVSQLYRCLLTVQPWVYFLMSSYEGSEKMVGMFLTSVYVIAKVIEVLVRLRLFKTATWTLLQSVNLGTKPTGEQLQSAGDSCPICHDDYATPVRLGCSHIFCELCIAAWLDREHTCPLCRAKVADEPTWRDGSTTFDFQLY